MTITRWCAPTDETTAVESSNPHSLRPHNPTFGPEILAPNTVPNHQCTLKVRCLAPAERDSAPYHLMASPTLVDDWLAVVRVGDSVYLARLAQQRGC